MDNLTPQQQQLLRDNEAAAQAAELFDLFCAASTMRQVLGLGRSMCEIIGLRPAPLNEFYPKLKASVKNWKAQALWKKFDMRAAHRVYNKGTAAQGTRVLVIGGGPCGLRTAIEAQLLGAKVVVIEKRDRISRNNVLHLWPFVITDLRNLGAKKFYGKFCAGSIDHISIRQLQCMLLKVALLLGVEIHEGVSFEKVIEPKDGCGWRAKVSPEDHAASHYEFDVLIGADGKRNTLEGFKRKEFRGKLAIAITANFINKKTEAEAKVEEISGVAFIFNQSFFKDLYQQTGIDLENIVYYKDETHYFVMTAKKHSLIDKGVIQQDFSDPAELLANINVNTEKLLDYAREAADFSTKYQMPNLEFAVNHYGKPDVAMFDFTSMFQAESSCKVIVRNNYRLMQCLVGDSLLEPFWPTGSGCARGFLSSMDAAYAIRSWNNQRNSILAVLAQRESIYRLLPQTTPENLHRDIGSYTLDPVTRYPNLNKTSVTVYQVKNLIDSDDVALLEQIFMDTLPVAPVDIPQRRKRRTAETTSLSSILLRWIKAQLKSHEFTHSLTNAAECFTHGKVLCVLINRYRPDLISLTTIQEYDGFQCNDCAFTILENEFGIMRSISSQESLTLDTVDPKVWLSYLEQICEVFRGEIPHIKHPKLDFAELKEKANDKRVPDFSNLLKFNAAAARKVKSPQHEVDRAKRDLSTQNALEHGRRAKKRRSHDKLGGNVVERMQRLQDIETNRLERQSKRRMQRAQQTENFYKSLHMLQANNLLRESGDDNSKPFEDYSLFMYRQTAPEFNSRVKELEKKLLYPDRERGLASAGLRSAGDDQFTDRIKYMEQRITGRGGAGTDKKPKDLLRAIGKIESNDWNIKEIEKKMEQSKKTEVMGKHREKVPKWSKEQFQARQHKMSKPDVQEENKFKEIDNTIKNLDKQLKEGSVLERGERGKNKVASIAGQLAKKTVAEGDVEKINIQKSNSKGALVFNQGLSEKCHFCDKKVYLMEKISAEGLVLHRSCLKCHHCHTNLRLGGYAFDRDNPNGLFYCTQHFRLPAKQQRTAPKRIVRTREHAVPTQHADIANRNTVTSSRESSKMPRTDGGPAFDLLDRGQTPERIEFENIEALSDGEPSLDKIIDENEWTDRNFGSGSEDEDSESDLSSSGDSDSSDVMFEDANGSPLGAQTLQLASEWIGKQKYASMVDSDEDDFYDTSEDDEADSQTEGEELDRKRAIRMQEVKLKPLPFLMTDTETEVQSDTESSSPDGLGLNSATEISTDSEFDNDPMVVRQTPQIFIDDSHVMKRPTLSTTRVHVKQGIIESGRQRATQQSTVLQQQKDVNIDNILMEFKPLVQVDPSVLRVPLKTPRPGDYMLNKTASTEGIASKKSLELKKRYLLGESTLAGGLMKSGSSSILDSKLKNFHSNISECQKLLNPGTVDSTAASLNILNKNDELRKSKSEIITPDEKENVYRNLVNSRDNEVRKETMIETINTTLIENTLKEKMKSPKSIETIDLVTPEKLDNRPEKISPIIDLKGIQIPNETVKKNQELIHNLEIEVNHNKTASHKESTENLVIDLTNEDDDEESPKTDEIIILSSIVKEETPMRMFITNTSFTKAAVDETENCRPRSPAMETSIKVPLLYQKQQSETSNNKKLQSVDPRMSSTSTSTTSSVDDIPHIILDSTTSPETPLSALPRLEIRDSMGQLMQIDSLMIVDGQYVGDPEDLKMMDMPAGVTFGIVEKRDIPIKPDQENLIPAEDKLGTKFDSRNDNKVDTLRYLPSIPSESPQPGFNKTNSVTTLKLDEHPRKQPPNTLDLKEKDDPISDSETEQTGQGLTETELSDWTADDAVSENFVDFALNSNKGTIKRNKKKNKKDKSNNSQSKSSIGNDNNSYNGKYAPIVRHLDFEEIDFMDTGSEQEDNSCAKSIYVANKALKQNRGYVEFVDNQIRPSPILYDNRSHHSGSPQSSNIYPSLHINEAINKEIAGIDFIEQGACILADNDLKTPVNEVLPLIDETPTRMSAFEKQMSALSFARKLVDPQLDSLNNDIEEDSLIMVASQDGTEKTTTEESDALTVVTSPMDGVSDIVANGKQSDAEVTPVMSRHMSQDSLNYEAPPNEKASDDLTYENYVRELQMKITEISNARDSIDIRRSRRKSSPSSSILKGDAVLEVFPLTTGDVTPNKTPQNDTTKRIEEITKERTKQKDLIHDLVMDKLQTKKHLNQTKRLNRRSNRHGCMTPTQPATPETIQNTTPQSLTSEKIAINLEAKEVVVAPASVNTVGLPKLKYKYPYSRHAVETQTAKLRLSDSDDILVQQTLAEKERHNPITKTQSFSHYQPRVVSVFSNINEPMRCPPLPPDRKLVEKFESPAEKQRIEARARARLKSSQDLGLSPDEKIQLLRKRYNLDNLVKKTPTTKNKSDDMKVRDMKMMTSKSVNDLAASATENAATANICDFTSDPNLTDLLNVSPKGSSPDGPLTKRRSGHKDKDPERRRSIIKAVSDFFHISGINNKKEKSGEGVFGKFKLSPKSKSKEQCDNVRDHSKSEDCIQSEKVTPTVVNKEEPVPPPIPPLPLHYQRSDDESYSESKDLKKIKSLSKASRQGELKRLRIAQEIQREQEEIEVKLKDLEARGVIIEKALRGESRYTIDGLENTNIATTSSAATIGANDEILFTELLEIWRSKTALKKRDEELDIRQQELQLEHRHAQLKEELNTRLSCKINKSSADVAAEGAILNEMLEIVAKRATLRPSDCSLTVNTHRHNYN